MAEIRSEGESAACGSGRRVVAESGQDEWGSRT